MTQRTNAAEKKERPRETMRMFALLKMYRRQGPFAMNEPLFDKFSSPEAMTLIGKLSAETSREELKGAWIEFLERRMVREEVSCLLDSLSFGILGRRLVEDAITDAVMGRRETVSELTSGAARSLMDVASEEISKYFGMKSGDDELTPAARMVVEAMKSETTMSDADVRESYKDFLANKKARNAIDQIPEEVTGGLDEIEISDVLKAIMRRKDEIWEFSPDGTKSLREVAIEEIWSLRKKPF